MNPRTNTKTMPDHREGRKVFRKLGTCSQTYEYILNREFNAPREWEEKAADPLSGGIYRLGYQCGMLWGASLAVGAEAYRRKKDVEKAIPLAIYATQAIMKSFFREEDSIDCRDITHTDFNSRWSFFKYMFSGRFLHCFKLAEKWTPEAIRTATEALDKDPHCFSSPCTTCTTRLAKKMGASNEQIVMLAGFSGGLGLSGDACGALSASIWLHSLKWAKQNNDPNTYNNPEAEHVLHLFQEMMGHKIACIEISEQRFKNIEDHSDYINNGGCSELIEALAI